MRRLIDRLFRRTGELVVLDHVPVDGGGDWREPALLRARERHGKAFRCARPDLDREVILAPGEIRVVAGGARPTQETVHAERRAAESLPRIHERRRGCR